MVKIDDAGWNALAARRKAFRDHHRDKFFAEVGMTKNADAQDISGAPQSRRLDAVRLLNLTRKGVTDQGHAGMITQMAMLLGSSGLGAGGGMGATAGNVQKLADNSYTALRDFFGTI